LLPPQGKVFVPVGGDLQLLLRHGYVAISKQGLQLGRVDVVWVLLLLQRRDVGSQQKKGQLTLANLFVKC